MRFPAPARGRPVLIIAVAASSLPVLSACDSAWEPLLQHPTIVGRITAVDTSRSRLRILVEENPRISDPLFPGGEKIWFSVSGQTPLYDARSGDPAPSGVEILEVGLRAAVVARGVILESYPAQAGADTVVIFD